MRFLDRLRFAGRVAEATFSESIPELVMVDGVITANSAGSSLLAVTRERALSVPGVLRGRNLICGIATLPLRQYGPDQRIERSPLFDQISRDVPNSVMLSMLAEDLLFDAIGWWHVTERGWNGYPSKVERIAPDRVHLKQPPGGEPLSLLPSGIDPASAVWIDAKVTPGRDMIRFDSLNPALLTAARRAIRRAIALEEAAEMYANDPRPLDYFSPGEGADPASDEEVEDVLTKWAAWRKQRSTGYVPAALRYNSVNQPTPADLQLVELQRRAALDIANAIGLDPEDLGISTTSRTYQNATDRRRDRINDVLAQYMKPITDRLSMGDITRQGFYVGFDLTDYLKADPKTRAEVAAIYHGLGALTADEIRTDDSRPALTAAQKRELQPEPVPVTPPVPAAPPALEAPQMSTHAAATFSEDDAARGVVLDASPHATFALDRESRTILGLAVPWGQTARSDGRKFRFAPGSLTWSDVSRVKLLRDHNYSQAVGRAVALDSDDTGLWVRFKVAVGPEGDRVLALAAEGVLDGLSVGVFPPDGHDKIVGTIAADGTFDVAPGGGALREVSLCAVPAFDDSRVTSIAASSTERDLITMSDTATEQTAPAPAATSATFSATDLGAADPGPPSAMRSVPSSVPPTSTRTGPPWP
ncbi:MAG: phage portal protein [Tessaracoccus sp.]|uniref:phage portal protein n=1 Tax=Tessaracoccus sp. TaxID=1971211 RepID=UPI001ECFD2FC|nr:phage portal protein [Tessaracoccus sp.]MBK7823475.1 phage portal protein [Tessaracoccus sp.]